MVGEREKERGKRERERAVISGNILSPQQVETPREQREKKENGAHQFLKRRFYEGETRSPFEALKEEKKAVEQHELFHSFPRDNNAFTCVCLR